MSLDPFDGMLEHFDLDDARARLKSLPQAPSIWTGYPASLERLGLDRMPIRMLNRFRSKIDVQQLDYLSPCWLWTAGTHDRGYGRFYLGKDPDTGQKIWAYAHRISFEHYVGPVPAGYVVDHQCNHKVCCNPTHLWPETNNDNLRLADQRRPWKRRNQYSKE